MSISVAVVGASGKLGSLVCRLISESDDFHIVAALGSSSDLAEALAADVIVDVSLPSISRKVLELALANEKSILIGTSGWSAERISSVEPLIAAHPQVGVIFISNFSLGSAVASYLATLAARHFDSIEIIEAHGVHKVDSPSGTAVSTAERIAKARIIASPGCFATATELGLLPLARAGLLRGDVRTLAITGSSGSGAAAAAGTHHPVRAQNLKTYKPLSHQHVPEIVETLASAGANDVRFDFVPVSAPLTRGIFVSSFVTLPASTDETTIAAAYEAAYANEPFVRVPRGRLPEVVAVSGSHYVEVGFTLGPALGDVRTLVAFSAIDNLIKGGAGQAIQSMNIALGLDETTTLQDPGGYP